MSQQIKSIAIFIIIVFALFYGAHKVALTSDVKFDESDSRAASFIDLVNKLDGIEFDIEFVNSLTVNEQGLGLSQVRVPAPPLRTGRRNPFIPAGGGFSPPPPEPTVTEPSGPAEQTLLLR